MTNYQKEKQKCSFGLCGGLGVYEVPEKTETGDWVYFGKEVDCPCKAKNYDEYDNQLCE